MNKKIAVIGGGPAGVMAAYTAAGMGAQVSILEKNDKLLKKLFISGKGRCNITNDCDIADFFAQVVNNPKFLMSALYSFTNEDLVHLLNENGLPTRVERGGRVFPTSGKSGDVVKTLQRMLRERNVRIEYGFDVNAVQKQNGGFKVAAADGRAVSADAVLCTAGGLSYPATGSTGAGYDIAKSFSHTVTPLRPALIPLVDAHRICGKMQGLSLKNVCFTLFQNGSRVYTEQGELLFTHFGLSGPVVLSASCYLDIDKGFGDTWAEIDLKPALDEKKLDARLLREFDAAKNKQLKNVMAELLPSKMIVPFLREARLNPDKPANEITKQERKSLLNTLKAFRIKIADVRPIEEAIVTAGGVSVREVNPKTMESKLVPGLYFAGEVLDVHAKTGGFNLQIAFSTGCLAGKSMAK
ncbi:MAG: NAD(P)/FAD-dependent oxidoreductase [Christensenellaceae bacterium]|jgi:predicted Rossmann fold flavoprotein